MLLEKRISLRNVGVVVSLGPVGAQEALAHQVAQSHLASLERQTGSGIVVHSRQLWF
jgi:hypothetical protein